MADTIEIGSNTFAEGQNVYGHKALSTGRRWCLAKILYITQFPEPGKKEAYMIEFRDGSRGIFAVDHIRAW